ncbi:MAG TPA: hypothetical protein VJQ45_12670 [Ktedonobacterales bacterium]|nr:hypothetical protein [Ktedonobacterales bacterium]
MAQRMGMGRWKLRIFAGVAVLALAVAAIAGWTASISPAHASSASAVADDGQAAAKFVTDGSGTGFRTANTIPWWGSSFTYNGTTYPFTMVGADPSTNRSTTIPTVLIPLKFVFSPKSNLGGGNFSDVRDPYTVDKATGLNSVQGTLDSPVFQTATYPDGVGTVQFGDAIQRATFDKTGTNGYHVLLGTPKVLPEVTITVPANLADVHSISARVDYGWFSNTIHQLINSLHISPATLPIFVTYNTLLYQNNNRADCCVVGYHGATTSLNGNGAQQVQTYIYEAFVSPGIFFNPSFVDALALSHEVSEWENDPFVNNLVPPWLSLGTPPFCQGNLETGDVIEQLYNAAFLVPLNGVTFHMQTEALLPWFERQSPSTAVAGAYSYPNTAIATTFAQSC